MIYKYLILRIPAILITILILFTCSSCELEILVFAADDAIVLEGESAMLSEFGCNMTVSSGELILEDETTFLKSLRRVRMREGSTRLYYKSEGTNRYLGDVIDEKGIRLKNTKKAITLNGYIYRVAGTDAVNVRTTPGINDYNIYGTFYKNQPVIVLREINGWCEVKLTKETTGWIYGQYLLPAQQIVRQNKINTNKDTTQNSVQNQHKDNETTAPNYLPVTEPQSIANQNSYCYSPMPTVSAFNSSSEFSYRFFPLSSNISSYVYQTKHCFTPEKAVVEPARVHETFLAHENSFRREHIQQNYNNTQQQYNYSRQQYNPHQQYNYRQQQYNYRPQQYNYRPQKYPRQQYNYSRPQYNYPQQQYNYRPQQYPRQQYNYSRPQYNYPQQQYNYRPQQHNYPLQQYNQPRQWHNYPR